VLAPISKKCQKYIFTVMNIVLKTNISDSQKRLGKLLVIFLTVGLISNWVGAFIWYKNDGKLPDDFLLCTLLMLPTVPISLALLAPPMFFGGYPAWIVKIFGTKFLTEMVDTLFMGGAIARKSAGDERLISKLGAHPKLFLVLIVFVAIVGFFMGVQG
jgi:hypothetical protein